MFFLKKILNPKNQNSIWKPHLKVSLSKEKYQQSKILHLNFVRVKSHHVLPTHISPHTVCCPRVLTTCATPLATTKPLHDPS